MSDRSGTGWWALAAVSTGLFLAVLSTTVVGVALPSIGTDLRMGAAGRSWVVDAYAVGYASLLVPGGVLGDRYGRKGLFLAGVAVFAAGALAAGLAPTPAALLLARALQGVGPALLVPGSLTILRAVFTDPRRRAAAIGLWSTSSGLALAAGPPLGGLVVAGLGWRWVFLLNVPLAALVVLLAAVSVPRLPRGTGTARFDTTGAVLAVVAVAALAYAVITPVPAGRAVGALGVLAAVAFVAGRLRRSYPLIDVRLFGHRGFAAANLAAFVVFFAFVGAIVYFSAYFQQVRGASPVTAGLDVAAVGVAYAVAAAASGRLVGRFSERGPLVCGLLVAGAATLGLLRLGTATPMTAIWWNLAALGAGIGLCGTPMSTIAMSAVGAESAGMASAIVNAVRQLGQVFGVAVLGALVYAGLPAGPVRTGADRAAFVTGLHHALWLSGLALLAAAVLAALLLFRRQRRSAGTGRVAASASSSRR